MSAPDFASESSPPSSARDVYFAEGVCVVQGLVPAVLVNYLLDYLNVLGAAGAMASDVQVPGSAATYGDPAFDTLLGGLAEPLSGLLGIPLVPTYSFVRVYGTGDELGPHVDRAACEHSVSLHLGASGAEPWGFLVTTLAGRTISVDLQPGDAVIYQGRNVRHWRQPCPREWSAHAFLHFVDAGGPAAHHALDRRPALGTPKLDLGGDE